MWYADVDANISLYFTVYSIEFQRIYKFRHSNIITNTPAVIFFDVMKTWLYYE